MRRLASDPSRRPVPAPAELPAAGVPAISASLPDWSREAPERRWDPSRRLLRAHRAYDAARHRGTVLSRLTRRWWALEHRFWSVVTQADIPLGSRIGGGLLMPHPNGIVIHPEAEVGPNCLVFQQVTIGMRRGGVPRIGGNVDIGAGAKILGPVTIGDRALIGANAVVLCDVPEGGVAVGIPARVFRRAAAEAAPGAPAGQAP